MNFYPFHVGDYTLRTAHLDPLEDLAYRRLMAQYHPDRMAGAAPELLEQAQKRAAEINRAYDRIRKQRGRR